MAEANPSTSSTMEATKEPVVDQQSKPTIKKGKRRRTRSHHSSPSPGRGFFVPGFEESDSTNLKQMSLNELMDVSKGVTNMFLAHEIAVDKDFILQKLKPEETSMEAQVKRIVHKAFWEIMEEQLKEDPPVFTQALAVLEEVREIIMGLLLPQHARLKEDIKEKLDLELIKQQAEQGTLDFESYAHYVIGLMAKLCAPVRDDEIAALRDIRNVVPLFQGIMKTLDNMKLDMANFTLQQARPFIVSQSVDYEKQKFKEFLDSQVDGLRWTREWLKRHAPADEELTDPRYKKLLSGRILVDAFVELLEWDEYHPLPETLVMDQKRILSLRDLTERTAVSTAVILLAFSNISGFVVPMDSQSLKETMKRHIDVLLEEFYDDTDLLRILPNVAEQVIKDVNDYLSDKEKEPLPESTVKNLKDQIAEMEDPNHRIRDLVQRRIIDFNKLAISGPRTAPLGVPPGLTLCQRELGSIAGGFVRLVSYNRAVFGEFYADIVENHVLFRTDDEKASTSSGNREA